MNTKPRLIIFASGTKNGGGFGFENLETSLELDADIVAVVSNHERGGVWERADRLGVPFEYFPGPFVASHYQAIITKYGADWVALSGWLKRVAGLHPTRTFNIHPALLSFESSRFGGPGHYGHHIHEKVKEALDAGEVTESGCTMHFVTGEYDRGPIFFECRVPLKIGMSANDIAKVVNAAEHAWQPKITDMVVHGEIRLVGNDIIVPPRYEFLPK